MCYAEDAYDKPDATCGHVTRHHLYARFSTAQRHLQAAAASTPGYEGLTLHTDAALNDKITNASFVPAWIADRRVLESDRSGTLLPFQDPGRARLALLRQA